MLSTSFIPLLFLLATSPLLTAAAPFTGGSLSVQRPLADLSALEQHIEDHTRTPTGIADGWTLDLNESRLVQFGEDEDPVWITEMEKVKAKAMGRKFFDITDEPTLGMSRLFGPAAIKYTYPAPSNSSKANKYINKLLPSLSTDVMKTNLIKFSSFRTRHYRSATGKESQEWLLALVKGYAKVNPAITVTEFPHSWGQNSIIAHIPSSSSSSAKSSPVTIIGAHQDSTGIFPFLPAPGADDDGSGTNSIVDAFRVLAAEKFEPKDGPVEFHWYSAEEGGLLGSQAVAQAYEKEGRKVKAMIQMDMTAWVKEGTKESVGVITDFVDPDLTTFIAELVDEYLAIPPVATKCGYACSDHASWSKAGFQSAFSIESTFEDSNHGIHSSSDTIDHPEFSFDHMKEFSKLAISFAVELGGA